MVGVPDASRSIPPGCVVALGPNGVPVVHSMAVLMYRAPGHLPEDVVKAEAIWPPQVMIFDCVVIDAAFALAPPCLDCGQSDPHNLAPHTTGVHEVLCQGY